MGTDVEATCAPPNHLPIATIASSPKPTADNWNCDQSHRIEHSDLTFDYCVARNDLHQRHRPVRSYSWTRPPAPLLPRSTRVEHMPHRRQDVVSPGRHTGSTRTDESCSSRPNRAGGRR